MQSHTVLIVDDEEYVVEELQEAFEDEGYGVLTASSFQTVAALSDLDSVDLLITDLKMPGMDGINLYLRLKESDGFTAPAILLSGHGAQSNRIDALAAGFSECLAKPVDLDELLALARRLCAGDDTPTGQN